MAGKSWLVVGGDGLVGSSLTQRLEQSGQKVLATTRRVDRASSLRPLLDLEQEPERWPWGEIQDCSTVVICAAVALVFRCEQEPERSKLINTDRTVTLAQRLAQHGARVIFLSSDKVFDGSKPQYPADAPTCPQTEYGRQKAQTEAKILSLGQQACVVRLTKVWGREPALLKGWCEALKQGQVIHPFEDMTMAPVSVDLVAQVIEQVGLREMNGIVQVSGARDVSYAEAGYYLANRLGVDGKWVEPVLCPLQGHGSKSKVQSPKSKVLAGVPVGFTSLDTSRMRDELGLRPPDAWEVLDWALGL